MSLQHSENFRWAKPRRRFGCVAPRYYMLEPALLMRVQPDGIENLRRKLDCAVRQICRNISAFSPDDLEEMVRERLIDPKTVPPDLRTPNVRYRLGLTK